MPKKKKKKQKRDPDVLDPLVHDEAVKVIKEADKIIEDCEPKSGGAWC